MSSLKTMISLLLIILLSCCYIVKGQRPGQARLVGSQLPYQGRLEVFYFGVWGTVCDDRFDSSDGNVACRQLGYPEGVEKTITTGSSDAFQSGTGEILMDGLECVGSEKELKDCHFNGWGINDCRHFEDIALICKYTPPTPPPTVGPPPNVTTVRIACPGPDYGLGTCNNTHTFPPRECKNTTQVALMGIVERLINNSWYPIPRKGWNDKAAKVVCTQLGYPRAGIPSINAIFPRKRCGTPRNAARCTAIREFRNRLSQTATEGLACLGNEKKLDECFVTSYAINTSSPLDVATIQCFHDTTRIDDCVDKKFTDKNRELYRLRSGPTPWQGRVEVRVDGVWGSICDFRWDIADANVVCRNLGFGSAKKVFSRSYFGRSSSATHFSGLKCIGSEETLSNCSRTTGRFDLPYEVFRYCYDHSGDAGVECSVPSRDREPLVRFTGSNSETFVEVKGQVGWGRLCFNSGLKYKDAHVICRETAQKFAKKFIPIKDPFFYGRSYVAHYSCTGEEYDTGECLQTLTPVFCINYTRIECTDNLPDLVPSVQRFQSSLHYVTRSYMYYLSCAMEENCLSSSAKNHIDDNSHLRFLLRFDSLTMNYGTIPFQPNLEPHEWDWHVCHQHYHSFEAFISYDILDLNGQKVAEGHKASFCLEDSYCGYGGSSTFRCSSGHQGISVNCGDLYGSHLDCQWIDITDVSPGRYIVRQIVNEEGNAGESNYKNNVIQCGIIYRDAYTRLIVGNCSHSDHI